MKLKITALYFFLLSLAVAVNVYGFQCNDNDTDENLYKNSYSVFLAEIVKTELEIISKGNESAKFVKAHYRTIETFKGKENKEGELLDYPLGYGTGFVGLMPGIYYVFFLEKEATLNGLPMVNICTTKLATLNLEGKEPKKYLEKLRQLKRKN